ncbi:MAG TPA: hypothetical protein VGC59_10350 [Solirubrobacteraceae bacterium]|jgi:hypothetical protein
MSPAARRPQRPRAGWVMELAVMLGAFTAATLVAELAGAPNLGTALTFGQIAFALAAVFVLLRR